LLNSGIDRRGDEDAIDPTIHQQQEEIFMVAEADAVVNPWAVVIHAQDARLAYSTVMSAVGFELSAPFTLSPPAGFCAFKHRHCRHLAVIVTIIVETVWHFSRRCQDATQIIDHHENCYGVEDGCLWPELRVRIRQVAEEIRKIQNPYQTPCIHDGKPLTRFRKAGDARGGDRTYFTCSVTLSILNLFIAMFRHDRDGFLLADPTDILVA